VGIVENVDQWLATAHDPPLDQSRPNEHSLATYEDGVIIGETAEPGKEPSVSARKLEDLLGHLAWTVNYLVETFCLERDIVKRDVGAAQHPLPQLQA
jgi:hypothetical protein